MIIIYCSEAKCLNLNLRFLLLSLLLTNACRCIYDRVFDTMALKKNRTHICVHTYCNTITNNNTSDAQNGNYKTLGDTRLTARRDVCDSASYIGAERCDFVCRSFVRVRRNKKLRKSDRTITTDGLRLLIVIVIGDFRRGCSCFRTKNAYALRDITVQQLCQQCRVVQSVATARIRKANDSDDLLYIAIFYTMRKHAQYRLFKIELSLIVDVCNCRTNFEGAFPKTSAS